MSLDYESDHAVHENLTGTVCYTVPVYVDIVGGQIQSVRVYDESVALDPSEDPDSPLVQIAEGLAGEVGWPAWVVG